MQVKLIHTTAFRLAMRYAVFVCLLTVICFAIIYWITVAQLHSQIDAGLRAEVAALTRLYDLKGLPGLRKTVAALSTTKSLMESNAGDAGPRQYLLADSRFHPMGGSLASWPERMRKSGSRWATVQVSQLRSEPDIDNDRYHFRMRAVTVALPDGNHLLVGQSLNEITELRESMLVLMLAAVALVLGAGLLGGAVVGRGVVRRLQAVTHTADTIMSGDLSQRIAQQRQRDEFSALASKLNAMLERIETLMKSTREVTENVAHDLRSPLTRLRARAEMALIQNAPAEAREEALRRVVEEIDGIVATLNAILGIARIESGVNRDFSDVDLTAVCRDAHELYEPLAEERQSRLVSRIAEDVHVRGNAQLMAQAIGNLLDNAIKYAPAPGHVSLTLERTGSGAAITVADDGPGIPAEMREKAFERFVRLDSSRSLAGNGLGLSLVKAVAHLHEARIEMDDNRPGLKIRLVFEKAS